MSDFLPPTSKKNRKDQIMKTISITTSSIICGVCILEDEQVLKEINLNNGLTHSESLMPLVSKILEEVNLTLQDMDLLAIDIGPGSFTGIRIGIATAKAFKDSLNIPCVGVNSLEGLSLNVKNTGVICSLIDARRENVFAEIFENIDGNYIVRRNPSFEDINNLLEELKNINPEYNITFVGDGAIKNKEKILSYLPNSQFIENNELSAQNIGIIGLKNKDNLNYQNIEPLYLRKSEAEQKLEEKQNAEK